MNYNYEEQPATTDGIYPTAGGARGLPDVVEAPVHRQVLRRPAAQARTPGHIQGFSDVLNPYPYITNYGVTVNYTLNPTTFIEGTYGLIRNELAGGNEGGVLVNESANRLNGLANFPLLYPNAGVVDERYYAYEVMQDINPAFWDGTSAEPAADVRVGQVAASPPAPPPNQRYPGMAEHQPDPGLRDQPDEGDGPAHLQGRLLQQPQLQGAEHRPAARSELPGLRELRERHEQHARHAASATPTRRSGVFTQYLQASRFIEGSMIYNNTEFYVQDNWRVNNRLTLDYGIRFTRQQPQYDQFQQMSNFFAEQWSAAPGAGALRRRLQQRGRRLLGQSAQRHGPAHGPDPDRARRRQHPGGDRHTDPRHGQSAQRHPSGG